MQIAVVGCGVGGLTAALLLSRQGHTVALFERFDSARPIGSGLMLQPTGMAVLRALGLERDVIRYGARIERLHGTSAGTAVLDVHYKTLGNDNFFGLGIHRSALFHVLFGTAKLAAIDIRTDHSIRGSVVRGDARYLVLADGSISKGFDLVVDASGACSCLTAETGQNLAYGALWATLDWPDGEGFDRAALQQRYQAARKMAGIMPTGTLPGCEAPKATFFWSLKETEFEAWRAAGMAVWKAEATDLWPELAPFLAQITDPAQLTFAHYAHKTIRKPVQERMIHIGDAWHCASPQLGQGANMAMLDAFALSVALADGAHLDIALSEAVRLRTVHVHLYQLLTGILTPVYQSDSHIIPWVRDRLIGPISKIWPVGKIQAALVSGLFGLPLQGLGLKERPN
jgi:salicylate hydroxylase